MEHFRVLLPFSGATAWLIYLIYGFEFKGFLERASGIAKFKMYFFWSIIGSADWRLHPFFCKYYYWSTINYLGNELAVDKTRSPLYRCLQWDPRRKRRKYHVYFELKVIAPSYKNSELQIDSYPEQSVCVCGCECCRTEYSPIFNRENSSWIICSINCPAYMYICREAFVEGVAGLSTPIRRSKVNTVCKTVFLAAQEYSDSNKYE